MEIKVFLFIIGLGLTAHARELQINCAAANLTDPAKIQINGSIDENKNSGVATLSHNSENSGPEQIVFDAQLKPNSTVGGDTVALTNTSKNISGSLWLNYEKQTGTLIFQNKTTELTCTTKETLLIQNCTVLASNMPNLVGAKVLSTSGEGSTSNGFDVSKFASSGLVDLQLSNGKSWVIDPYARLDLVQSYPYFSRFDTKPGPESVEFWTTAEFFEVAGISGTGSQDISPSYEIVIRIAHMGQSDAGATIIRPLLQVINLHCPKQIK